MKQSKALTIYKASAGSGKTFTLSVEYIKLLMKNPMSYRTTLAVTFTNKATEEMKNRILCQLYGIWKGLPQSKDYIAKIKGDLGLSEQFMSERARIALLNIVHNYSYFRIETIDSFFQSVLRNLARELDLTANLRIELNDKQIESIAVDELVNELNEKDELLKWILGYIKENIDEDKNWNVIDYIKSFGENIFREFYKTNSKKLNGLLHKEGFFDSYTRKLRAIRDEAEKAIAGTAEQFFNSLSDKGIDIADFSYGKSGVAGYFLKIKNKQYDKSIITARIQKALDENNADNWVKKSAPAELREFVASTLVPMLAEAEQTRQANWKMYESAVLTLKHLNQLRLLNSIERKVREMNTEANRFLLSDTHTLLHSLIKDTDSPFIFEKIGSRLENVMIDEFQDTSTIQWQNFKVLLEECMSHNEEAGNLIVGDVKQSIYRWRSGDWRMLNNIQDEFPRMQEMLSVQTLTHNYRSARRVIDFNNAFFEKAAAIEYDDLVADNEDIAGMAEQLRKAYADVRQEVPEKRNDSGIVRIELISPTDYTERTLSKTVETVDSLLKDGAAPTDIAIIVRSNNIIQQIAEYFSKERPDIKIVSDEAFRLDNSIALNIMVSAMHCLTHKEEKLTKAFLAKAYQTRILGRDIEKVNNEILTEENIDNSLPKEFVERFDELGSMPIYELAERIYQIFRLDVVEGEDAYVYAFLDCLKDFLTNNMASLVDFVDEWHNTFASKTIQAKAIDGIRLITIHKSKGLEFKHVVIPFCDWRMEKTNTIWCNPTEEPFCELPLVPVDFSAKQMKGTIYEPDYVAEHLQNIVDNMNLLYVAFTRAETSLTVIARRGNASLRSNVIERAIADINLKDCTVEGDIANNDDDIVLTYGEAVKTSEKEKESVEKPHNIFAPKVENIELPMKTYNSNVEFKQSNKSHDFIDNIDNDDESQKQQSYIKTGLVLHHLFSMIETTDDIDNCINEMEFQGLLDESIVTPSKLKDLIHKRFDNPQVREWFSSDLTLFNECTIVEYNPVTNEVTEHRPDRVMKCGDNITVVDFKFGKQKPQYKEQVQRYMALLRDMGYNNIKGYLWYVYSNAIDEVKFEG